MWQRKISESYALSTRIRVFFNGDLFLRFQEKKNYLFTISIFESFLAIHMKTLKGRKDDSIPYGACVMLEEHDVWHHRSGKPPFSSAYAWTVGQTGKKNIRKFKQNRGKCEQGLVGAVLLALVVQKVDNAIYRISHYRLDSAVGFPNTYLLDKDLSSEQRYSTFKQLGPHIHVNSTFWEKN